MLKLSPVSADARNYFLIYVAGNSMFFILAYGGTSFACRCLFVCFANPT